VLGAFTRGVEMTAGLLAGVALAALAIVVAWSRRARAVRQQSNSPTTRI
jgi:hypothetical protein